MTTEKSPIFSLRKENMFLFGAKGYRDAIPSTSSRMRIYPSFFDKLFVYLLVCVRPLPCLRDEHICLWSRRHET